MNTNTPNKRIIQVKYLPPTNHRGGRITLTEDRLENADKITIPYSYKYNNATDQAIEYLENKGIKIESKGQFKGINYLISDSWQYDTKEFISIK